MELVEIRGGGGLLPAFLMSEIYEPRAKPPFKAVYEMCAVWHVFPLYFFTGHTLLSHMGSHFAAIIDGRQRLRMDCCCCSCFSIPQHKSCYKASGLTQPETQPVRVPVSKRARKPEHSILHRRHIIPIAVDDGGWTWLRNRKKGFIVHVGW